MNKVSIHINELGPVRNQSIELKPVMLFTGESSLGKSYVNFLSYYLFYTFYSERMKDFLMEKIDGAVDNKDTFSIQFSKADFVEWLQNDVKNFFVYLYNFDEFKCDVKFIFEGVDDYFDIKYTKVAEKINDIDVLIFQAEINGKKDHYVDVFSQKRDLFICSSLCDVLCAKFLGHDIKGSYLLPPGRASLLTGDYTVQRGSSKMGLYDLFLRDNDFINSETLRNKPKNPKNTTRTSLVQKLINGELMSEKEGLFLITKDRQKIPIGAVASSIRELTPLLQLILSDSISNRAICIEEPEAHLHPEMQISIADLLASCINGQAFLQITTHSDYFMQRINQLLKYGSIREQAPDKYNALCKTTGHLPDCYLNKEDLNAYYFSSENGQTKIELLNIGNEGVPLSTFFNAVGILSKEDELLNDELERLKLQ